jgi:arylsulfatase A-like enzyme
MSCYGVSINPTPTLDDMAANGVMFKKAFMPAPVCSATRSAIITGTMQTTFGLHNHRSSRDERAPIYLPDHVKTIPELFRQHGYYTFNAGKDDYNFVYQREELYDGDYFYHPIRKFYGIVNAEGDWQNRKPGQPFFGQIELKGGKNQNPVTNPIDRKIVNLPPYYADHDIMRDEWAKHHDQVRLTDKEVKDILDRFRSDGLLENTVVFFFSDHGMRGIRHKQFLYDGGIHVPLIITWYSNRDKLNSETIRQDLVSGLDIGATSLVLAGINIPEYMESRDLFATEYVEREFVISARDRCDFTIDRLRAVRTQNYKYIKNFLTDRPYLQPNYRDNRESTKIMKILYQDGKLNDVQARFISEIRPEEELYNLNDDPHETINLVDDPNYKEFLEEHRQILTDWTKKTNDKGQYPESEKAIRAIYERWGDKCVNPEYNGVKLNEQTK